MSSPSLGNIVLDHSDKITQGEQYQALLEHHSGTQLKFNLN
jgi:hypothetical protein